MENVYLTNMFPDYVPPEELQEALSQAAIVAADIFPETGTVEVAVHSENYIPQRLLDLASKEISTLYGLRKLTLNATHPETELHKVETEELRQLFKMQRKISDQAAQSQVNHLRRMRAEECAAAPGVGFVEVLNCLDRIGGHSINVAEASLASKSF